jgi:hypothetical protein
MSARSPTDSRVYLTTRKIVDLDVIVVLFRVYPLTPDFVVQDFRPIGDAVLTFLELESQRGERYKQRENRDYRCYFSAFCFTHVIATRERFLSRLSISGRRIQ